MGNALSWILEQLGFEDVNKSATLVVVGLDNAGKTTLITRLVTGKLNSSLPPTKRATDETFQLGGITFNAWDLGGHKAVRHLWSEYSNKAHGIIYMIDATDKRRFQETGEELEFLLMDIADAVNKKNTNNETSYNEEDFTVPIAIFLNKYDMEHACSMKDILKAIKLEQIIEDFGEGECISPPIEVFSGSVIENRGYQNAFKWLSDYV
jgi:GTP-binding protein SAR1